MASGYYQIPMHKESVECTAFVTPDGQYEFLAMPFGLKNAPSIFQRKYVCCCLYGWRNVGCCNKKWGFGKVANYSWLSHECWVLIQYKKMFFSQDNSSIFGIWSECRWNPPESALSYSVHYLATSSVSLCFTPIHWIGVLFQAIYARIFLFYENVISFNFGEEWFVWRSEHEEIRQKVIFILTEKPVLVIFNSNHPIELHTDTSSRGYGAILLHKYICAQVFDK